MTAVVVIEGIAIVLLSILVLGLLRSHALILRALHELGAGLDLEDEAATTSTTTRAPAANQRPTAANPGPGPVLVDLESGVVPSTRPERQHAADIIGLDLAGQEQRVAVRGRAPNGHPRRTLLAFLTTGCSVCQTFWEEFGQPGVAIPGAAELVVVAKGDDEESPSTLRKLAGDALPVVRSSGAWIDYEIPGSPYFVFVEDGRITGEGSSTTWPQVRDLMQQAVDDAALRDGHLHVPARTPYTGQHTDPHTPVTDRGERDRVDLIDAELLDAGLTPGHPSLYLPPDRHSH